MFRRKKANMNIYFYINHVAICMCNSSKCWFKHPLPYPKPASFSHGSTIMQCKCIAKIVQPDIVCIIGYLLEQIGVALEL